MSSQRISGAHSVGNRRTSRQAGGTLTGLIIGLIIGLSIAVWVAVTIMKTPVPFIDRLGKQSEKTGELGDPNSSLPGGARDRHGKSGQDEPEAAPPAVPPKKEKPPAGSGGAAESAKPAPAERAKPEKNAVSSGPPAAPADSAADEKFTYYLQAGAFREVADAEASKAKLAMMGVAATISERRTELGSLYRVRIGPYTDVESMNRIRTRLSDNGVDAAVVRVPK